MVDLEVEFKRNGCYQALRYTIRSTSQSIMIYAVATHHGVEQCMNDICLVAQAPDRSSFAESGAVRSILGERGASPSKVE